MAMPPGKAEACAFRPIRMPAELLSLAEAPLRCDRHARLKASGPDVRRRWAPPESGILHIRTTTGDAFGSARRLQNRGMKSAWI